MNTSLVSIANDMGDFNHMSWVATAYLLTYVGKLLFIVLLSHAALTTSRVFDHHRKAWRDNWSEVGSSNLSYYVHCLGWDMWRGSDHGPVVSNL